MSAYGAGFWVGLEAMRSDSWALGFGYMEFVSLFRHSNRNILMGVQEKSLGWEM